MTSRTFHPDQQGRQKLTRFCNYCHKNGHKLNWCRKKMRDEEVRKIRNDMWSKREISPKKKSFTEQFNRKPPNNDAMNNFLEVDVRSSPSIERLSNEEANWQHEDEQFTPPERRLFPKNNGMSFNRAESSDSLPSGYSSLQSLFLFSFYILFKLFIFSLYLIAPSLLPTSNLISILLIQITSIRRAYKNLFSKDYPRN